MRGRHGPTCLLLLCASGIWGRDACLHSTTYVIVSKDGTFVPLVPGREASPSLSAPFSRQQSEPLDGVVSWMRWHDRGACLEQTRGETHARWDDTRPTAAAARRCTHTSCPVVNEGRHGPGSRVAAGQKTGDGTGALLTTRTCAHLPRLPRGPG